MKEDIKRLLALQNPLCITTGFDRSNLYFETIRPKSKDAYLKKFISEHPGQSGIVYCSTRKTEAKGLRKLDIQIQNDKVKIFYFREGSTPCKGTSINSLLNSEHQVKINMLICDFPELNILHRQSMQPYELTAFLPDRHNILPAVSHRPRAE